MNNMSTPGIQYHGFRSSASHATPYRDLDSRTRSLEAQLLKLAHNSSNDQHTRTLVLDSQLGCMVTLCCFGVNTFFSLAFNFFCVHFLQYDELLIFVRSYSKQSTKEQCNIPKYFPHISSLRNYQDSCRPFSEVFICVSWMEYWAIQEERFDILKHYLYEY